MTLIRRGDWKSRLTRYLLASRQRPFAYGTFDCALWVAGAIEAETGVDLGSSYRGRYTTYRGGLRVMRRDGHRDHLAYFAAHLPEAPMAMAAAGDVVALGTDEGIALGIVQGASGHAYVLPEGGGHGMLPLGLAERLLKVG